MLSVAKIKDFYNVPNLVTSKIVLGIRTFWSISLSVNNADEKGKATSRMVTFDLFYVLTLPLLNNNVDENKTRCTSREKRQNYVVSHHYC